MLKIIKIDVQKYHFETQHLSLSVAASSRFQIVSRICQFVSVIQFSHLQVFSLTLKSQHNTTSLSSHTFAAAYFAIVFLIYRIFSLWNKRKYDGTASRYIIKTVKVIMQSCFLRTREIGLGVRRAGYVDGKENIGWKIMGLQGLH